MLHALNHVHNTYNKKLSSIWWMQIAFTQLLVRPDTQDQAQLRKWKEEMKKENDQMASLSIYAQTYIM